MTKQALRNAIESIFPENQHLLCTWHLWNTVSIKLAIGKYISLVEYNLRRTEAEVAFKAVMTSYNEMSYRKALADL